MKIQERIQKFDFKEHLIYAIVIFIGIIAVLLGYVVSVLPVFFQGVLIVTPILCLISLAVFFRYQNFPLYLLLVLIPVDTFLSRWLSVNGITQHGTLLKDGLALLLIAIIFFSFLPRIRKNTYSFCIYKIDVVFAILIFVFFIGLLNTPYLPAGFFGLRGLIWFSAVFLFIRWKFTTVGAIKVFNLSLVMSAFVAVYGIAQVLIGAKAFTFLGYKYGDVALRSTGGFFRAISTTDSAATLATYAMLWIAVLVGLFFYSRGKTKMWLLMLVGLLTLNMFLTTIRGAWIGLFVGLFFGWLVNRRFKRGTIVIGILFLLVMVVLNIVSDGFLAQRLLSSVGAGTHAQSLNANSDRVSNILDKLDMSFRRPMLGHGLGTTGIPSIKYENKLPLGYIGTDNFYLKLFFETGVLGLSSYLIFYVFVLIMCYKAYFAVSVSYKGIIFGIFMALISLAIMNMFHSILESPLVNVMFWFFIAIVLVIYKNETGRSFEYSNGA